jgi:hypothetical protein
MSGYPHIPVGGFDHVGYDNPGGTVPQPYPSNIGPGNWIPGDQFLLWTAGAGPNQGLRQAIWRSPVFDLRPELKAAGPAPAPGNPRAGAQAIWKPGGAGGQLYLLWDYSTVPAGRMDGLAVVAQELAHPFDPSRLRTITQIEDVTTNFTANKQAALLVVTPPGSGMPVRFWQFTLRFEIFEFVHPDPTQMFCSPAYY